MRREKYDHLSEGVTGTIYGYVRISKRTQNEDRQIFALKDICDEMVTEKISADEDERPKFDSLILKLQRGDMLMVLDIDRAFRNMIEAILVLHDLEQCGVQLKILNGNIDLNSEFGKLMYIIRAHYAETELRTLRRRTLEGLAAARARGIKLGRPFALSDKQIRRAHTIVKRDALPVYKVAKSFGVSHSTLALSFERLGL